LRSMIHPVQSLSHRSVISIFLMNFLLEFFGSAWRSFWGNSPKKNWRSRLICKYKADHLQHNSSSVFPTEEDLSEWFSKHIQKGNMRECNISTPLRAQLFASWQRVFKLITWIEEIPIIWVGY
jgi:hypothetical protein